ncbi:uncharacterized protein EI97DRAFT_266556 [Westerdykella ornata]|uniref:Uncharacterized protein n=1 Tax=Westerdykella ornata TaxID=318751 RepID=A0A6A6J7B7_WESOR|nr:uncharacterized protein EI97DRAFT_266556 [Westerdykella ornata]KAF2271536.1 hypothetical protein EI97DRAFT_266556 [Westerdykella ornata]
MKTVPTLCATATVVGTSALGLAFAREDDSPSSANKGRLPPPPEPDHRMSAAVHASLTTPAPLHSPSSPTSLAAFNHSASRCDPDEQLRRGLIPKESASLQRRHTLVNNSTGPSEHEVVDDIEALADIAARRPSWIKRLSVSASHSSSRNSSPGPLSPSVSCSNGSMAFSHDGSTAPIIGKRPPSPLPPNKLVKRSSSVLISRDSPSQGSGSRRPSFRRPATSHQRSATLQHQSALEIMAEDRPTHDLPLCSKAEHDVQYTQFFTTKVAGTKTLSKKRAFMPEPNSFKRIFPDGQHKPTLVLAKSVTAATEEVDDSSSDDADSVYFVSRPGTPLSIAAIIGTTSDPRNKTAPEPILDGLPSPATGDASRSRRSFSISDILPPGIKAKRQRTAKLPGAKLTRRASHRATSAPLSTVDAPQNRTLHGESVAASSDAKLTEPCLGPPDVELAREGGLRKGEHNNAPRSSEVGVGALPRARAATIAECEPASMHQSTIKATSLTATNHNPPSPTLAQAAGRPSRNSTAPSEHASTLVGSDNDARGVGYGEESDADLQSETVFDSLRTGATRSTSGARGPRIETIFDESPPSKVRVTALRDLLPKGTFREQAADGIAGQQSIAEEEESITTPTPVRTTAPEQSTNGSPSLSRGNRRPVFPTLIPSSPPDMPKPLSLGTLEWDATPDDDGSSRWSLEEEEDGTSWADSPTFPPATLPTTPVLTERHSCRLVSNGSGPRPSSLRYSGADHGDRDARSSIFDWSEQQPTDRSSGNRSPPRPRTVHGKKDADGRGSRSMGRRAPSGLHARSQSVPVVPDASGKRSTVVTNKFGTWGVGSKGVTEDWNDDFDFSEINEDPASEDAKQSHRVDSGAAMVVPKTIQDQQTNVLANIGLLREWGLLIEELKEHRIRAANLGLLQGPTSGMWEEVDAMIDLADQEAEQDEVPRLSPPSTPGFDEAAFDDVADPSPNHGRERRTSGELARESLGAHNDTPAQPDRPRRKSILPSNHDIFGPQSSPVPAKPGFGTPQPTSSYMTVVTRPRKDSEAKARSVIEALQRRKSVQESESDFDTGPPSKKVPFDTATLRRIVPYVSTLTRKVKDALREAEGLYSSPSTSPREPRFSKLFQAESDLASQVKVMTIR